MRKAVYVILVLCCFIIKTYSINRPYYHFKQLSIKEGLPTSIISLYDDKNGSLWVGTTQGIYRFNGEKIKKYNLPYLLRKNSHYISRKTKCSTFAKHFVPKSHLLTQFKM